MHDTRETGHASGGVAARLRMRSCFIRAELRERRNPRRDRLETRLPFSGGGMQSHARRFPGRPRKAVSPKAADRHGLRTLLSDLGRITEARRTACWMGLAGIARKGSAASTSGA